MTKLEELIERNKREGLLCACNKVRIPYNEPRIKIIGDIIHGYETCITKIKD